MPNAMYKFLSLILYHWEGTSMIDPSVNNKMSIHKHVLKGHRERRSSLARHGIHHLMLCIKLTKQTSYEANYYLHDFANNPQISKSTHLAKLLVAWLANCQPCNKWIMSCASAKSDILHQRFGEIFLPTMKKGDHHFHP